MLRPSRSSPERSTQSHWSAVSRDLKQSSPCSVPAASAAGPCICADEPETTATAATRRGNADPVNISPAAADTAAAPTSAKLTTAAVRTSAVTVRTTAGARPQALRGSGGRLRSTTPRARPPGGAPPRPRPPTRRRPSAERAQRRNQPRRTERPTAPRSAGAGRCPRRDQACPPAASAAARGGDDVVAREGVRRHAASVATARTPVISRARPGRGVGMP